MCGFPLVPPTSRLPKTGPLPRTPTLVPGSDCQPEVFDGAAQLVLQLLPSGVCVTLDLAQPTMLGRGQLPDGALYDLTPFQAVQHGVSRHHCLLLRRNSHLLITDLESLNGTFINGRRLVPRREYVLRHGDRLVLGSLHILVSFH
jgi:pSer/pThr/pTyr-binding forkhead associated (FHA) protein